MNELNSDFTELNTNLVKVINYKFTFDVSAQSKQVVDKLTLINSHGNMPITMQSDNTFLVNEDCVLDIRISTVFGIFSYRDIIYFHVNNEEKMRTQSALSYSVYETFRQKDMSLNFKWYFSKDDIFGLYFYSEIAQPISGFISIS